MGEYLLGDGEIARVDSATLLWALEILPCACCSFLEWERDRTADIGAIEAIGFEDLAISSDKSASKPRCAGAFGDGVECEDIFEVWIAGFEACF